MNAPPSPTLPVSSQSDSWQEKVRKTRHDLRSTAGKILGFGQLLLEELPGQSFAEIRRDLQLLNRAARQLVEEGNRCLDFDRIRSGQSDLCYLHMQMESLSTLIANTCKGIVQKCQANNLAEQAGEVERIGSFAQQVRDLTKAVQEIGSAPDLPIVEPAESKLEETAQLASAPTAKQGLILAVDDQEANRDLLCRRLTRMGYEVLAADNGQAALEIVAARPVDLILLDIMMPVLDGLETLKRLKENPNTQHLPVIMLSAENETGIIAHCLRQGADDFIPKPFDSDVLMARLESALAKKRLRDQEKTMLERTLSLHLPPRRVKQILKDPELLQPGSEKLELSLLFTDISNFSRIADRVLPDRLFKLLNRYYAETIACIHQHEGTVIQLIGDSVFAVWNAPEWQPHHPALACRAALALRDRLKQFNAETQDIPFETRLGLHTGLACVGNLGSADRFNYTAIGASVNLASRLETLNTHLGTDLLASAALIEALPEGLIASRSVGFFRVKGSDRVVEVFEVLGDARQARGSKAWLKEFAAGLQDFKRGKFAASKKALQKVARLHPGDGPAKFYLRQIERLQKHPPEPGWLGEINMEDK